MDLLALLIATRRTKGHPGIKGIRGTPGPMGHDGLFGMKGKKLCVFHLLTFHMFFSDLVLFSLIKYDGRLLHVVLPVL